MKEIDSKIIFFIFSFFNIKHNVQYKKRRADDKHYRFGLLLS